MVKHKWWNFSGGTLVVEQLKYNSDSKPVMLVMLGQSKWKWNSDGGTEKVERW